MTPKNLPHRLDQEHVKNPPEAKHKIGLVAGWGSFPIEVAQKCIQDGGELYVVGLRGHADPQLATLAHQFCWMGVAKLGSHIRFFKRHGVPKVALAGKLFKDKLLFHGFGWIGLLPDLTSLRAMSSIFLTRKSDARDDSILSCVVRAYQNEGIEMISVNEAAPKLLVDEGVVVGKPPNHSQQLDIQFGWRIARQMGGLDIGQSIIVKDRVVLAVEAIEGTDAMITRTGTLCPQGGFTMIKIAKPQQDMRFDVPTIGPRTVEKMASAGGKIIVIEAEKTILVERQRTLEIAKQLGISIVALKADAMENDIDMEAAA